VIPGIVLLAASVVACSSPNPPIADAGKALAVNVGSIVQLDGSKSVPGDQGDLLGYRWTFVALPAGSNAVLNNPAIVNPSFLADAVGDYKVELVVTEGDRHSVPVFVTVTASACGGGAPQVSGVTAEPAEPSTGQVVHLSAAASDPDNDPSCGLTQGLSYRWTIVSLPAGSLASLNHADAMSPSFVADVPGKYGVQVVVTDPTGRSGAGSVEVTVSACGSAAPTVVKIDAAPASPGVGGEVTLAIEVADADNAAPCNAGQTLLIESMLVAQPAGSKAELAPTDGPTPAFVPDVAGDYIVRVTVSDGTGRSSFVDHSVTVGPCGSAAPAVTGVQATPASPNVGDPVDLAITVDDLDNAPPCELGQTLTVASAIVGQPAGSAAVLVPAAGASPAFVPDVPGAYVIRTTVEDGTGLSGSRDTTVIVSTCGSASPVIDEVTASPATPDLGVLTVLSVAASDADNAGACDQGQALSVSSEIVSLPAGSKAVLEPAVGPTPAFVPDVPGAYVFRLTVTDSTGRSSSKDITVTASACGSHAPVAQVAVAGPVIAGPGVEVTAPKVFAGATVALDGSSSSDADNACLATPQVLSYAWFFVTKPAGSAAAFNDAALLNPSFVADEAGAYRVGLRVTDGTHFAYAYVNLTADPAVLFGTNPGYQVAQVASGSLFNHPEGIAVDASGAIYVVQNGSGRVTRTSGGITMPFSIGGYLGQIHDIAYHPASGALFVTSRSLNGIVRLDGNGGQVLWTSAFGSPYPYGIAFFKNAAGQDRLVVGVRGGGGGGNVRFYDPGAASPAASLGSEDFGDNVDQPWGVAAIASGGVNYYYAADDNAGDVWRTDGANDRRLAQQLDTPTDIALAPSGKVVVADSGAGLLMLVDNCANGNCPITPVAWGEWQPWGVAFASSTTLLVTDRAGNALYRIDGTF
jgi:hypothetical protein